MHLRAVGLWLLSGLLWASSTRCLAGESSPAPGTHGHYAVLTATPHQPPPFAAVDVLYGPREDVEAPLTFGGSSRSVRRMPRMPRRFFSFAP